MMSRYFPFFLTCVFLLSACGGGGSSTPQYNLNVTYTGTGSGRIISNPAGIDCPGDCAEPYKSASSITLTVQADAGSVFTGWSGDCSGTAACILNMDSDKNVNANFSRLYPLSVLPAGNGSGTVTSTPVGISCGSDCAEDYLEGSNVSLVATPLAGSIFTGWSDACSGTGACIVTMDAAKNVMASFALGYTLNVSTTGTASGSVSSTPVGIDCGADCSETYANATSVTLVATPASGAIFTGWSGDCTGLGSCVVNMTADRQVSANFDYPLLNVSLAGSGTGNVSSDPAGIDCGATCSASFSVPGIMLTAVADSGQLFEGFSGDCVGITSTCNLELLADSNVTAIFNPLTANQSGGQLGLDGIDDVAVHDLAANPATSALDLTTFTIEAWIFPLANRDMLVAADSAYYLMVKQETTSSPLRIQFSVMTSTGFPASVSFAGNTSPLQLNQWNHVVGMVSDFGNTMQVAVNGELSPTTTMGGDVVTSFNQSFSVGNSHPSSLGNFPFAGRVDEVRLSKGLRYLANFTPGSLIDADSAAVGLWHFDEAETSTVLASSSGDDSLTGLDGAMINTGVRVDQNTQDNLFYSRNAYALSQIVGPSIIGDFDEDGINDIASVGSYAVAPDSVAVLLASENFATAHQYTEGHNGAHSAIKSADLNHDTHLDLVVSNGVNNDISVLLGDGTGSFAAPVLYAIGNNARNVHMDDFNNDTHLDIAVSHAGAAVSVLLGSGDGSFAAAVDYAVSTTSAALASGDFNKDGKADLVVANSSSNTLSLLAGLGDGTFAAATTVSVGTAPGNLAVVDVDGNGNLDILSVNSSNLSVLMGNGDGSFASAVTTAANASVGDSTINDFNQDGYPDVAFTQNSQARFKIMLGNASGGFDATIDYLSAEVIVGMTSGDLNNDGKPELLYGESTQLQVLNHR